MVTDNSIIALEKRRIQLDYICKDFSKGELTNPTRYENTSSNVYNGQRKLHKGHQ